jgi:hypothetical protein
MVRAIVAVAVAVAVSLVAAGFRFGDSAHAIGLLTSQGGRARHPFHLAGGYSRYTLVVTATVLPPYRGDARVRVDGCEPWRWSVYDSEPAMRLPFRRRPEMRDLVYRDLRPRDRLAFWVVLKHDSAVETGDGCSVVLADEETGATVLRIPIHFAKGTEVEHGAQD